MFLKSKRNKVKDDDKNSNVKDSCLVLLELELLVTYNVSDNIKFKSRILSLFLF